MSDIGIIESLTRRVEALELQWMLRHDGTVALPFVQKLDERISKLEGAATKPASASINDLDASYFADKWRNCTRYEIPAHFNVRRHGEGSEITMMAFNPEASPSGIPFEVALMYLKAGRRVSHPQMEDGSYVAMAAGRGFNHVLPGDKTINWVVASVTFISDAWYVLPKEEKP